MAIPVNIENLINQRVVESTRIEFKSDFNPNAIIHSICAFANDIDNLGGGYIIVGVEEKDGSPVFPVKGIEQSRIDNILKELVGYCHCIEPLYNPVVEPVLYQDVYVIVIWVSGGYGRPYKASKDVYGKDAPKSSKYYYIRKFSSTIIASPEEEKELFYISTDIPFDDRINYHADVTDMKPALLADYLHTVGSDLYENALNRSVEDVSTDMQLVRGPSEYRKPVNVGLMFFNEHPENYFSFAQIEVVDKPDPTGIGMTEKTFKGPLDRQLRDALAYIRNYIIKEYVTKVPDSELAVRAFNWPYQAVEEALSNAVYHKSYQIHEPITVTVTPEKMEILSLPGPDRSITDEHLENRILISRRYRNRRIGDFLKELEIVEGRNTGVPLILSSMKNNGSGLPSFETEEDRSYFLTILPVHPYFLPGNKHSEKAASEKPSLRRTREELRGLISDLLAKQGNMSANEIAYALGYKTLNNTVRAVVNDMLKSGEVTYLYPDKPNSRNQKICITRENESSD